MGLKGNMFRLKGFFLISFVSNPHISQSLKLPKISVRRGSRRCRWVTGNLWEAEIRAIGKSLQGFFHQYRTDSLSSDGQRRSRWFPNSNKLRSCLQNIYHLGKVWRTLLLFSFLAICLLPLIRLGPAYQLPSSPI